MSAWAGTFLTKVTKANVKIHSDDVNEYLDGLTKESSLPGISALKGTTEMILALRELGPAANQTEAKKKIVEASR
jgi:hypothetical protein